MIETFFLDWASAFGIGLLFGLAARGGGLGSRAFRWGMVWFHLGFVPIALAYYALRPDWMWMYWIDHAALPLVVTALAFAVYEFAFVAGFAVASALDRMRAVVIVSATAIGAAITACEAVARNRLFRFGSLAEFQAGLARDAFGNGVAPEIVGLLVTGAISLGVVVLLLARLSRSAQPAA